MRILVDADACPVKEIIEGIAKARNIPVLMFIDTSHILRSAYSEIISVSKAPDAVDFVLINRAKRGDIVVTQDYGVAAMALSKGAYAIHQNGMVYLEENIDRMLMERHIAKEARRSGERAGKNAKRRTAEEDKRFAKAFDALCVEALKASSE